MQTYEILVKNRSVKANSADTTLVRTSIGIDQVHVLFDNTEWLGFPVTITFAQGDSEPVTDSLLVSEIPNPTEWVAESYATIPWEVIDENGPIRITLQGTDSQGRHIITAKGAPLTVEEAGDVTLGDIPESAPTVDQWQQAYADAMAAANQAASLVATLQEQLSSMVDAAQGSVDSSASDALAEIQELLDGIGYATEDRAGIVQIGDGIDVLNGVISAASSGGLNTRQRRALENLVRLALATFNSNVEATTFDQNVTLAEGVLPQATPVRLGGVKIDGLTIKSYDDGTIYGTVGKVATMDEAGSVKPDGTSIVADQDGTIHGYTPDGTTITAGSDRVLHGANTTPVATLSTTGKVKPDGTSITIDLDGTIHGADTVPIATESTAGKVKPDGITITIEQDGTIHGQGVSLASVTRYGYVGNSAYSPKAYVYGAEDGRYTFADLTSVGASMFYNVSRVVTAELPVCAKVLSRAFVSCSRLTAVDMPACTSVEASAFARCTSLAEVSLPACSFVGRSAFYACHSLSEISLPACSYVNNGAFYACTGLVEANLPACGQVSSSAFRGCTSLAEVSLPVCSRIASGAFSGCTSLSSISLPACENLGSYAFCDCGSLRVADLPSCTWVNMGAFMNCGSLTSVGLSRCVTVGTGAFRDCRTLTEIGLPSCAVLSAYAFSQCVSLRSVSLPRCEVVGEYAFAHCEELSRIDLPACRSLMNGAFTYCTKLSRVYLTDVSKVPTLDPGVFDNTPMADSSYTGTFGSIVVREYMYSTFVAAENWSDYSNRIMTTW